MKNQKFILGLFFILLWLGSCCRPVFLEFEIKNLTTGDIFILYKESPENTWFKERQIQPKSRYSISLQKHYDNFPKNAFNRPSKIFISRNEDMRMHYVVEEKDWRKDSAKINYYVLNIEETSGEPNNFFKVGGQIKAAENVFVFFGNEKNHEKDSRSVKSGQVYQLPRCSFKNGDKFFSLWVQLGDPHHYFYDEAFIDVEEKNITLEAAWFDRAYAITFFSNKDESDEINYTQNIEENKSFSLRRNIFINSGFRFLGWTDKKGSSLVKFSDNEAFPTATKNMILYAIWENE